MSKKETSENHRCKEIRYGVSKCNVGCLNLAFSSNCWVKILTGRKGTMVPVIAFRDPHNEFICTYAENKDTFFGE